MHTPNELRDISFEKAMFGGYDINSVNDFMTSFIADYTALFKENAVLKNKLKLLADTVEEYRSVDEAMRKALITAQNMANEMVANAEQKSKEMVEYASNQAKAKIEYLTEQVKHEEQLLKNAKKDTATFISEVMKMYEKQGKLLLQLNEKIDSETENASSESTADITDTEEIAQEISNSINIDTAASPEAPYAKIQDTADFLIQKIEKEIEEKSVSELGDIKLQNESVNEKTITSDDNISLFEVNLDHETDNDNDASPEVNRVKRKPNSVDQQTRKYDFSELKFGKNYDFNNDK